MLGTGQHQKLHQGLPVQRLRFKALQRLPLSVYEVSIREFPKIRGTLFWGPCDKDPTVWGAILGSPIFGNSHKGARGYVYKRNCKGTLRTRFMG